MLQLGAKTGGVIQLLATCYLLLYTNCTMNCICPECKNPINLAVHQNLAVGHVIECDTCGITLEIKNLNYGGVEVEIVDEGK